MQNLLSNALFSCFIPRMSFRKPVWCTILILNCLWTILCFESPEVIGLSEKSNCSSCSFDGGSGSFLIASEENCTVYYCTILPRAVESIIRITARIQDLNSIISKNNLTSLEQSDAKISAILSELATNDNSQKFYQAMDTWYFHPKDVKSEKTYLSRTHHMRIYISVDGNWNESAVNFTYEEVEYKGFSIVRNDSEGEMTPWVRTNANTYRPNSVMLLQLRSPPDMKVSSILITLNYLEIDQQVGEYLLIGSGSNPFEGAPPLFISNAAKMQNYQVNNENAYVVFVSRSPRKPGRGFNIHWQRSGEKITDEKTKNDYTRGEDVLESMPICIYNISAALAEFNKSQNGDGFKEFRNIFADIATKYAKAQTLPIKISPDKVSLFRVSGIIQRDESENDLKYGAVYAMLKIQGSEKGQAAFSRQELKTIIDQYDERYNQTWRNGYKIAKCPDRKKSYKSWLDNAIFAVVPIFCCIFLLIWISKSEVVSKYFLKKEKSSALKPRNSQTLVVNENDNILPRDTCEIPKVTVTPVTVTPGRRFTLDLDQPEMNSVRRLNEEAGSPKESTHMILYDLQQAPGTGKAPKTQNYDKNFIINNNHKYFENL
ncbi:uncharacterized protein LOC118191618 isoform X2 [Stegodyphus dumicola]|uniref:uncharacterized protein LOC118191618 isoform X2 n=1 Tax=Stegodyphus dumicola TaxID=202533 RepID=UPI0015A9A37E|nr:uncharacterized protein LOC118191618 isoform X2 [Stegodyphus dumicola]